MGSGAPDLAIMTVLELLFAAIAVVALITAVNVIYSNFSESVETSKYEQLKSSINTVCRNGGDESGSINLAEGKTIVLEGESISLTGDNVENEKQSTVGCPIDENKEIQGSTEYQVEADGDNYVYSNSP